MKNAFIIKILKNLFASKIISEFKCLKASKLVKVSLSKFKLNFSSSKVSLSKKNPQRFTKELNSLAKESLIPLLIHSEHNLKASISFKSCWPSNKAFKC